MRAIEQTRMAQEAWDARMPDEELAWQETEAFSDWVERVRLQLESGEDGTEAAWNEQRDRWDGQYGPTWNDLVELLGQERADAALSAVWGIARSVLAHADPGTDPHVVALTDLIRDAVPELIKPHMKAAENAYRAAQEEDLL